MELTLLVQLATENQAQKVKAYFHFKMHKISSSKESLSTRFDQQHKTTLYIQLEPCSFKAKISQHFIILVGPKVPKSHRGDRFKTVEKGRVLVLA